MWQHSANLHCGKGQKKQNGCTHLDGLIHTGGFIYRFTRGGTSTHIEVQVQTDKNW